jgi:hypothetical protein
MSSTPRLECSPPSGCVREDHPWGRLFRDASRGRVAVAGPISAAVAALERWSGLAMRGPFDVVLDEAETTPIAAPLLARPLLRMPAGNDGSVLRRAELIHELAHLLRFSARSPFLSEGFAVAAGCCLAEDTRFPFEVREPAELHRRAREGEPGPLSLRDYFRGGARLADLALRDLPSEGQRLAYARAGSFAVHLIAVGGPARFASMLDALRAPDLSEARAIEARWDSAIAAVG